MNEKDHRLSRNTQVELESSSFQFLFEEDTGYAEALQCLRKGTHRMWSKCDEYGQLVKDLAHLENRSGDSGGKRLKIQAFFAKNDSMIRKRGQKYVTECSSGHEDFHDVLDFESRTLLEADHDSLSQSAEVLEMFCLMARDRTGPDGVAACYGQGQKWAYSNVIEMHGRVQIK
ncbi:hypothetical protein PHISCL_05087 [Aspergillus sclerotialis]|uniref:Uncharacterized protein n=1 Tax=Aspergillus sclerotialis TaxID=2070753 RepID=A0A3A2ZHQ7_9EURO|nr:hypothetical protein PHISCL_05087 [Aspergillus sclerotialis]